MKTEGYLIDIICDTKKCNTTLELGGRDKADAWKKFKKSGWYYNRKTKKYFCQKCLEKN